MNASIWTWLIFWTILGGSIARIVSEIIRRGNKKAAQSKQLEIRRADEAREAGEYARYCADPNGPDPRD